MKILLLSAYDAASHRHWHSALTSGLSDIEWTVLTLPARYFSWRVRGNSLSWAYGEQRELLEQPYDLVLATSMVDITGLRGLVPALAQRPWVVYFHENQFDYPPSRGRAPVEPQLLSIYNALAASAVIFNSDYNRQSFLHGAQALLKKLPDHVPAGLMEQISAKAQVLPVPLSNRSASNQTDLSHPVETWSQVEKVASEAPVTRILWSARWEYDKAPERLLAILRSLKQRHFAFKLAILGEQFRQVPEAFAEIKAEFADQLAQFGYAPSREEYLSWLAGADILLSTALHEFQGIAVLEAVEQGCVAVLPNRQVYPELFGPDYLYPSVENDIASEAEYAAEKIISVANAIASGNAKVPSVQPYRWQTLASAYQSALVSVFHAS